jgi:DnaJ-class molecular chaperone
VICPTCHGNTTLPIIRDDKRIGVQVCPECQGSGHAYCCDTAGSGDRACPVALDLIRGLEDLGYVVVPAEPTEEMLRAGDRHSDEPVSWIYRAMLAARPGAR